MGLHGYIWGYYLTSAEHKCGHSSFHECGNTQEHPPTLWWTWYLSSILGNIFILYSWQTSDIVMT